MNIFERNTTLEKKIPVKIKKAVVLQKNKKVTQFSPVLSCVPNWIKKWLVRWLLIYLLGFRDVFLVSTWTILVVSRGTIYFVLIINITSFFQDKQLFINLFLYFFVSATTRQRKDEKTSCFLFPPCFLPFGEKKYFRGSLIFIPFFYSTSLSTEGGREETWETCFIFPGGDKRSITMTKRKKMPIIYIYKLISWNIFLLILFRLSCLLSCPWWDLHFLRYFCFTAPLTN